MCIRDSTGATGETGPTGSQGSPLFTFIPQGTNTYKSEPSNSIECLVNASTDVIIQETYSNFSLSFNVNTVGGADVLIGLDNFAAGVDAPLLFTSTGDVTDFGSTVLTTFVAGDVFTFTMVLYSNIYMYKNGVQFTSFALNNTFQYRPLFRLVTIGDRITNVSYTPLLVGVTGPTGLSFTGPTGSIAFFDGDILTGSTGLTYTVGDTGPVVTVDGDIVPSVNEMYSLGSTGTKWKDLYVATGSIYIGDARLSSTGTAIVVNGSIVAGDPEATIGTVDEPFKSIHIGPGTVFIGPTGSIGNDDNGIIYTEYGFASPTIVLGATIPGAPGVVGGGVRLTLQDSTGPIQYQHLGENGIADGPLYTLATSNTGSTGSTGPTGPSTSFVAGTEPYATSLITTTVGTAQTRVYEIGPITSTATSKFMIMATVSYYGGNHNVQMTVGVATSSGAVAADSTNIVSNISPLVLPQTTTSYFMGAAPGHGGSTAESMTGHAIHTPGSGTFYYTIWMSSSSSHTYTGMTAMLSVLKIQY